MIIVPLANLHRRDLFDCGKAELNDFLRQRAGQYARQDFGRTYVAVENEADAIVLGYYTVAVSSVPFEHVPANLPRHPVPALHLGRLATDVAAQGHGIGRALLFHALRLARDIADAVGLYTVEVVALDEEARNFYRKYGFQALRDDPLHLYLPLKAIRQLDL